MQPKVVMHLDWDQKEGLIDGIEIVPAGVLELIRLQEAGFAYIKP